VYCNLHSKRITRKHTLQVSYNIQCVALICNRVISCKDRQES